jgi:dihydroxy-acid dehydratase
LLQAAQESGRRIVAMVKEDLKPSDVMTRGSFVNAITALAGIGGSTNAVVHLLAIAGRLGIDLKLEDFDEIGSNIPLLVNLQPAGEFLMEDLFRAGGLLAVLKELKPKLDKSAITVTGKPLVNYLDGHEILDGNVIKTYNAPLQESAGIAILKGNIAPLGAVIKPAAASPELLNHRGPALVFESVEDLRARIDDPNLDVTKDTVLILRGCGPKGYPGMPEVSNMPLPSKLLAQGVRDMVRICDGRMSGTAYGTVILHVAPESAAGGPLAKVRTGDIIVLDVPNRSVNIEISDEELAARPLSAEASAAYANPPRGWERIYIDHVMQADHGADLDFLRGASGSKVGRESH